ncbi:hypothetical protein SAMN05192539_10202 [Paraburkholderia diazotrophica]|uniref:Uncharacterized protein n=1 Tax=Paraburkholderia diazotrophica TaxID=667676 RepID=A0A1H7C299_9BURK|nr:hypothetical protein SAMN05192539_10202 [Paraburkholderia diazotrophica]
MIRGIFVTAKGSRHWLAGWLAFLLSLTANAAIHQVLHADLFEDPSTVMAPAKLGSARLNEMLSQSGIARDSEKARMLATWIDMVLHDPVIARRIPGGARALEQVFLDEGRREALMSSGLARLTPADRLLYLQLFTRLLDQLVPVNCFGLVDITAAMSRITIAEMSDADAGLYLLLLYKVLANSESEAPARLPTPQEYTIAIEALSRAIVIELDADPVNLDRYALYTAHLSAATPSDVCWLTRVTLHAIAKMPETERDFILLPAITDPDAGTLANPVEARPAQAPLPSWGRPRGTTIP